MTGPLLTAALFLSPLFLSGCWRADDEARQGGNAVAGAAATAFANRMAGASPPAAPAKPFEASEKTGLLEFAYAYPAQAAAVPTLVARFQKEMRESKADALRMARQDSESAKQSGFPFHAHSLETRWTVTADTPRFLALESATYMFSGGAHGMTGYDAVLWDKERQRETAFTALTTAPAAFAAAIRDPFCRELDRQRAKKRGAPVVRGNDPFTQCIDPMKEVLTPISKDGKRIDGVQVTVAPYSAGPYAEGSYAVKLPVDAALYRTIKTEYQDAFAAP